MNRFFIREAALLASPEGTLNNLAEMIGVSEVVLAYAYSKHPDRGKISPELALKLQKAFGERMPAKLLRPDRPDLF